LPILSVKCACPASLYVLLVSIIDNTAAQKWHGWAPIVG